jgi:hypothetical protein
MVLDLAPPRPPHTLYRLDVLRAVLYRTAPVSAGPYTCSMQLESEVLR